MMAKLIDPEVKSHALALVARGESYRSASEALAALGHDVSHESVRQWCKAAEADPYTAPTPPPPPAAPPAAPLPRFMPPPAGSPERGEYLLALAIQEGENLLEVLTGELEVEDFRSDLEGVWAVLRPVVEEILAGSQERA